MKKISQYLKNRNFQKKTVLDEKTVFYIFKKIIQTEYGNKGVAKLKPSFYKDGKLFILSSSSAWANELWSAKDDIINKMNQELKTNDIKGIKIGK